MQQFTMNQIIKLVDLGIDFSKNSEGLQFTFQSKEHFISMFGNQVI